MRERRGGVEGAEDSYEINAFRGGRNLPPKAVQGGSKESAEDSGGVKAVHGRTG